MGFLSSFLRISAAPFTGGASLTSAAKKLQNPGETAFNTKQTASQLSANIGSSTPGTNKHVRTNEHAAVVALSKLDFTSIPSSGGFSLLGKNVFGQDVARDNTTGAIGTTTGSVRPISATARSLGKSKDANSLAKEDNNRRKEKDKVRKKSTKSTGTTKRSTKTALNDEDSILGNKSILG